MILHIAKGIWAIRKKRKNIRAQKHGKKKMKKEKKDSPYLKIKDRVMQKKVRVSFRKIPHTCTS